jgi:GTP-binding protein
MLRSSGLRLARSVTGLAVRTTGLARPLGARALFRGGMASLRRPQAAARLAARACPTCRELGTASRVPSLRRQAAAPLKVALVGRPNVGKSTLFNKLTQNRAAITNSVAGTTRDRREGFVTLGGFDNVVVIDTGGLEDGDDDISAGLKRSIVLQSEAAVRSCDVVMFMVDVRAGITSMDMHYATWLRKRTPPGVPIHLLANKAESDHDSTALLEAYQLALGDPLPISAEHGEGLSEVVRIMMDREVVHKTAQAAQQEAVQELAAETSARGGGTETADGEDWGEYEEALFEQDEHHSVMQLAIVGRQNAGKSTLLNRLVNEERVITGDMAGLTRDAIAVDWDYEGQPIRLVDTAGIRRVGKRDKRTNLEQLSVNDALKVVDKAQVVALMLDLTEGHLTRTDLSIASHALKNGRALVIVGNKCDLYGSGSVKCSEVKTVKRLLEAKLDQSLVQAAGVTVVPISAKTGQGISDVMPAVLDVYSRWNSRVGTGPLNRWLDTVVTLRPPPQSKGRNVKLKYMTQAKTRPPTFVIFTNLSTTDQHGKMQSEMMLPESYVRFLTNQLREEFALFGLPVRLHIRGTEHNAKTNLNRRRHLLSRKTPLARGEKPPSVEKWKQAASRRADQDAV